MLREADAETLRGPRFPRAFGAEQVSESVARRMCRLCRVRNEGLLRFVRILRVRARGQLHKCLPRRGICDSP